MAAQWRRVTFSLSGCRTSKPASTNSLQRSNMPYLRKRGRGGLKAPHRQIRVQTQINTGLNKYKLDTLTKCTHTQNKQILRPKRDANTACLQVDIPTLKSKQHSSVVVKCNNQSDKDFVDFSISLLPTHKFSHHFPTTSLAQTESENHNLKHSGVSSRFKTYGISITQRTCCPPSKDDGSH